MQNRFMKGINEDSKRSIQEKKLVKLKQKVKDFHGSPSQE